MPFEARGFICIEAYDGSADPEVHNTHYHSTRDIPSNLNEFSYICY
jgi:hypothetical protein